MNKIKELIISYRRRDTKCPMGTQIFTGSNANVLAANYQSAHPELEEYSFKVIRSTRKSRV